MTDTRYTYNKAERWFFVPDIAGANEVQLLTLTGSPTGGNFDPTIAGVLVSNVAYNASVSAFQNLIDATSLSGKVTVGGSTGAWTLTFGGELADTNVAATTVAVGDLTGGSTPGVTVTTPTGGVRALAPTETEIAAGIELTGIESAQGFTLEGTNVEAPSIDEIVVTKVPSTITLPDPQITFYKSSYAAQNAELIRSTLAGPAADGSRTSGFILRFHPVDGARQDGAAGDVCEVWPVDVLSNAVQPPASGALAKFDVKFSVNGVPSQSETVVA